MTNPKPQQTAYPHSGTVRRVRDAAHNVGNPPRGPEQSQRLHGRDDASVSAPRPVRRVETPEKDVQLGAEDHPKVRLSHKCTVVGGEAADTRSGVNTSSEELVDKAGRDEEPITLAPNHAVQEREFLCFALDRNANVRRPCLLGDVEHAPTAYPT